MAISVFPVPVLKDNYVWVIQNNETHCALIVDPGAAEPVEDYLKKQNLKLQAIIITHHHWDHTNGAMALKKKYDVPIFAPTLEKVAGTTNAINNGDTLQVASFPHLQAISIPGHTLGHTAYYAPGMVFTGDTLFAAGCGRLFEGTAEQMYRSLQQLAALHPQTKVYCGHEYTLNNLRFAQTVEPNNQEITERMEKVREKINNNLPSLPSLLADEIATNPFLRCDSIEIIRNVERYSKKQLSNPIAVFAELRQWKDHF